MNKQYKLLISLVLMIFSASNFANSIEGLSFSHHDWELACDNTGTCRAAGYHSEEIDGQGLSVLLTRKAGKGMFVKGQLKLANYDDGAEVTKNPSTLSMDVNGSNLGKVTSQDEVYSLSQQQTDALVKAVSGVSKVLFQDAQKQWQLSGKGATAVLLKMDEFQRRLGTQGALVRKGNANEANVLKAKPIPVIKKPTLTAKIRDGKSLDNARKSVILNALQQTLSKDDDETYCPRVKENDGDFELMTIHPLTTSVTLVSAMCWTAAYNAGAGFWLMDADLTQAHKLITVSGSDYSDGVIDESHKSRGLGDCFRGAKWAWDGKAFVLTEEYTTGMCRLIEAGGAWMLPTTVSTILFAND